MIPYQAFRAERVLTKNGPHRVYGVYGDAYLQSIVIASLLAWSVDEASQDFNLDKLGGQTSTIPDVLGATGNLPFLSDRRAVVVKRAEELPGLAKSDGVEEKKPKKGGISPAKLLVDGLEKLPATTVLILARTPETPEPGSRLGTARCINAAIDKEIDRLGLLIDCTIDPKNVNLVVSILQNEAAVRSIPLAPNAAAHMVARCGNNLEALLGELDKCSLRAGVGLPVTAAIIDEMTRRATQETAFDLTDAIGDKQGGRALALLRELMDNGEPPELLMALMVRHLRQLLQARAILDARLQLDGSVLRQMQPQMAAQLPKDGRDNLANLLQSQHWLGRRLGSQARNFSTPQLQAALESALEADLAMKGIEGDGGFDSTKMSAAAVELFVASLCR